MGERTKKKSEDDDDNGPPSDDNDGPLSSPDGSDDSCQRSYKK